MPKNYKHEVRPQHSTILWHAWVRYSDFWWVWWWSRASFIASSAAVFAAWARARASSAIWRAATACYLFSWTASLGHIPNPTDRLATDTIVKLEQPKRNQNTMVESRSSLISFRKYWQRAPKNPDTFEKWWQWHNLWVVELAAQQYTQSCPP